MSEKYNKLVRDKIPEILDKKGIKYEKRIASDLEYKNELVKKLQEEIVEFATDLSVEELADVLEVLEALKKIPDYVSLDIVRLKKKEERGGFEQRFIVSGEKD